LPTKQLGLFHVLDERDRLVGQAFRQMVALLGKLRLVDVVIIFGQR
jgi:hypothetical protein